MVGATRFELARPKSADFKSAVYTFPPSAYKITNQNLEKYSGVPAPTSSMFISCSLLCLIERAMYRALWNCSLGRKWRTRWLPQLLSIAASLCVTVMFYSTTQYGQSKSVLSLTACLSTRPARLDIVIIRLIVASVLWGVEPYDGIHRRKPCVRSRTANKSYCL